MLECFVDSSIGNSWWLVKVRYSKEALEISASLVEINPEIYTVWNYRKMAVKNMLESEADGVAIREILNGELRLCLTEKLKTVKQGK
ncbi:geranylgeranyl transferase type-2 subunit alpha 1 isoform X2 [Cryptomeria japonica]|uniref:geranylgeranyl transferase type-2 subunit alpha 1 isoform X2 n=1 Tax=Cryptomeria japonica TaxID=3369 RepID=UPI0027DA8EA2|nr:geranylgeranyl transferase type-2 subunit alpha 1 isoform X2 [Cryptomeria japonica]